MSMESGNEFKKIVDDLTQKKLSRRDFIIRASALGVSLSAIGAILAACGGGAATPAATETGTPSATSTATAAATETAAATATASATSTAAGTTSGTSADVIVGAFGQDIDDLDPQYFKSIPGYQAVGNLYELLMNYETQEDSTGSLVPVADANGNWQWTPGLAESMTVSDDKKTITFKLRSGIKFADGNPITKADWIYTFNRTLTGQGYTKTLFQMLTVTSMDQITFPDDSTMVFALAKAHPFADKLMNLNVQAVLEQAVLDAHKTTDDPTAHTWLTTNAAGTSNGPYNLKSWTPGTGWELELNPNYWNASAVKNKGVVYKVIPNAQDRLALITKGDIDIAHDLAPKDMASIKNNPDLKIIDFQIPWPWYIGLNNKMAPFDKKEVRQAIAYATPYQTIIDKVMYGFAQPLKSPIATGMPGSDYSFWHYDTDLTKAKSLLDQAGVTNLSFEMATLIGRDQDEQVATWLQANLQQIGVNMTINKMTSAQFYDLYNKWQLQTFLSEWYSWVNDPLYHVYWHFLTGAPTNATQYSNPQVDSLINDNLYETDQTKRMNAVKQIQQIVVDDCPWIFLFQNDWTVTARKNVMHYPWNPDTVGRFMYTYKA